MTSEHAAVEPHPAASAADHEAEVAHTVEAIVRRELSRALGGRRGILEAAVPTISFTFSYISTKDVRVAIGVSVGIALVMLAVRLAQRGTIQYVANALFGIGIGCFFVWLSARNGGDESAQALAYFLPGLIYNGAYAVLGIVSIALKWPVMGFLVGSVSGDALAWHRDHAMVKLCRNLTWLLVLPCLLRVIVQVPIYLAGSQAEKVDAYVGALGVSKLVMGWPLQLAAFAAMIWVLNRDKAAAKRAD